MAELNNLEESIICNIASTYPYTFKEIKMIFIRCKSFDNTIKIIESSMKNATGLITELQKFENG